MPELNLSDSIKLAKKYGINFVQAIECKNELDVLHACHKIGFPIAMKIVSSKISHKTDAGGVILNISSQREALESFSKLKRAKGFLGVMVQKMVNGIEIIIGGKKDENFGPTILFGLGGIFVETFKDYSLRVCPITLSDSFEMIRSIKGFEILNGARGQKGANIHAIQKELLKVNHLLLKENIKELDLNPLIATPSKVLAVDARIITE